MKLEPVSVSPEHMDPLSPDQGDSLTFQEGSRRGLGILTTLCRVFTNSLVPAVPQH